MLFSMRNGYIQNIWSRPMDNLARFPSTEALVKWSMPRPGELLVRVGSPVSTLFCTLLLTLLYGFLLADIMLIFNTVFNRATGTAITAAVHCIGYMMMNDFFSSAPKRWSLLSNSIFVQHLEGNVSVFFSVTYLLLVICILSFAGPTIIRRADFKYSSGEQNG